MPSLLGLIVTLNPPPEFLLHFNALGRQVEQILLIDNGSAPRIRHILQEEVARRGRSVVTIFNDLNLGVAVALNQGFQWALEHGYEQVVTFDQDSYPAPGMIRELLEMYASHPHRDKIAIIAPNVEDPLVGIRALYLRPRGKFSFERVSCRGEVINDVAIVITSGSLNNLAVYQKLGPFRDDFFIDYVDTEYCLRANQRGYKIAVACNACLHHRLGDQQKKQIGALTLRPTFHSPLRWYYINRNRIVMLGMYVFKTPYWALYDILVGGYAFVKMLLYEDQKLRKILAVMLGIFDGLFRRMGPIASSRKRWLTSE
jgi:rhamnosyltransferase